MTSLRKTEARTQPVQKRAQARRNQILEVTAELLEEVGQDDLTTILVAKRAGVSVGTLYHYFPNKYAIMYALAEQWVGEMDLALQALEAEDIEAQSIKEVCRAQYRSDAAGVYQSAGFIAPSAGHVWGAGA